MPTNRSLLGTAAASAALLTLSFSAGSAPAQAPAIDADDIGGVVTSPKGPEAGVWVIAETDAFKTRFAKIVVTDDQGRYVVPDLPPAEYRLWVRGYGLADSDKTAAKPGAVVNLTAKIAPTPAVAAQVFVARPPNATPTGRYLGTVHFQRLLREAPAEILGGVLDNDIDPLEPDTPLPEITRRMATYNLVSLAVVDQNDRLVGAVTVDDVLDHLLPRDWRDRDPAAPDGNG